MVLHRTFLYYDQLNNNCLKARSTYEAPRSEKRVWSPVEALLGGFCFLTPFKFRPVRTWVTRKTVLKMKKFTITCYGKTESYPESQRKEMMNYYLEGMACCEGSEQERYARIYSDLAAGMQHCFDLSWDDRVLRKPTNGKQKRNW